MSSRVLRAKSLLLFACFAVLICCFTGHAEEFATEREIVGKFVASHSDWDSDVIVLLQYNLSPTPAGFLVSGVVGIDDLYGLALIQSSNTRLLDAAQAYAIPSAFLELALVESQEFAPEDAIIDYDLALFLLFHHYRYELPEVHYIQSGSESGWIGVLVRFPVRAITSLQQNGNFDEEGFTRFVYANGLNLLQQGKVQFALRRFSWIAANRPTTEIFDHVLVHKAAAHVQLQEYDAARGCITPILDIDDYDFYQAFSPNEIVLIVSILDKVGLAGEALEMAAFAVALYPDHTELQAILDSMLAE